MIQKDHTYAFESTQGEGMREAFVGMTERLKEAIGVTTDREVAEALGLSEKAFASRKRRGSFPETELYALVARRPELPIDTAYVLTGEKLPRHAAARANALALRAGLTQSVSLDQFVSHLIRADAARNGERRERYQLLLDLAEHLDDRRFDLLLTLASELRMALVADKTGVLVP